MISPVLDAAGRLRADGEPGDRAATDLFAALLGGVLRRGDVGPAAVAAGQEGVSADSPQGATGESGQAEAIAALARDGAGHAAAGPDASRVAAGTVEARSAREAAAPGRDTLAGSPPAPGRDTLAGSPPAPGRDTLAGSPPAPARDTLAGSPPAPARDTLAGSPPAVEGGTLAGALPGVQAGRTAPAIPRDSAPRPVVVGPDLPGRPGASPAEGGSPSPATGFPSAVASAPSARAEAAVAAPSDGARLAAAVLPARPAASGEVVPRPGARRDEAGATPAAGPPVPGVSEPKPRVAFSPPAGASALPAAEVAAGSRSAAAGEPQPAEVDPERSGPETVGPAVGAPGDAREEFLSRSAEPRTAAPAPAPATLASPSAEGGPSVDAAPDPSAARGSEAASPRSPDAAGTLPGERAGSARVEELSARIESLAGGGGGRARIRLNPPQLGEIDLEVKIRGDSVAVRVVAHEHAARVAIEDGRMLLTDGLASRSLRMESLDVSGSPLPDRGEGGTSSQDRGPASDRNPGRSGDGPGGQGSGWTPGHGSAARGFAEPPGSPWLAGARPATASVRVDLRV